MAIIGLLQKLVLSVLLTRLIDAYSITKENSSYIECNKLHDGTIDPLKKVYAELNAQITFDSASEKLGDYDIYVTRCFVIDGKCENEKKISKNFRTCGNNCGDDDNALEWKGFFKIIGNGNDNLQATIYIKETHMENKDLAFKIKISKSVGSPVATSRLEVTKTFFDTCAGKATPEPTVPTSVETTPSSAYEETSHPQSTKEPSNGDDKFNNLTIIIPIIVAVVVLIIALSLGYYFCLYKSSVHTYGQCMSKL